MSATPIDYSTLIQDQYFLNLADYRLQLVKQNHLNQLRQAMPQLEALLHSIDAELAG